MAIADLEEAESRLLAQKKKERSKGISAEGSDEEIDVITSEELVEEATIKSPKTAGTKKSTGKKPVGTKKGGK
ncbi:MAG: hypothetical protein EOP06_25515 [Proteobacteria bacterium]|nr:MAG: hypothetical protein EOP06_25515 [Pseudomonadota bacterium]